MKWSGFWESNPTHIKSPQPCQPPPAAYTGRSMKTIQLIIEAAILLTLIIVCVLLAGKRTVAVDGDVQLSHSQVSDIVDAIEGGGDGVKIDKVQMGQLVGSSVKIDKAQMDQLVGGSEAEWEVKRDYVGTSTARIEMGWEPFAGGDGGYIWIRKRIK